MVAVMIYCWTSGAPLSRSWRFLPLSVLSAVVCQLSLYYGELYELRVTLNTQALVVRISQCFAIAAATLISVFYLLPSLMIGRTAFGLGLGLAWGFLIGWRLFYQRLHTMSQFRVKVLIVGTSEAAQMCARELRQKHPLGYELRGFIGDSHEVGREL